MQNRLTMTCAALALMAAGLTLPSPIGAQQKLAATNEAVARAVAAAWKDAKPELKPRIEQDAAMQACSAYRNDPPQEVANRIMQEAKATIVLPADGRLMGDWKKGERGSLDGHGLRMGDDPKRGVGGNCYACHQLSPKEISFGTLGPPLTGYGKIKGHGPEAQRETYEKIFNTQAFVACSNMPRYGHNKILTPEQIADFVAFLLDPASPVNQ